LEGTDKEELNPNLKGDFVVDVISGWIQVVTQKISIKGASQQGMIMSSNLEELEEEEDEEKEDCSVSQEEVECLSRIIRLLTNLTLEEEIGQTIMDLQSATQQTKQSISILESICEIGVRVCLSQYSSSIQNHSNLTPKMENHIMELTVSVTACITNLLYFATSSSQQALISTFSFLSTLFLWTSPLGISSSSSSTQSNLSQERVMILEEIIRSFGNLLRISPPPSALSSWLEDECLSVDVLLDLTDYLTSHSNNRPATTVSCTEAILGLLVNLSSLRIGEEDSRGLVFEGSMMRLVELIRKFGLKNTHLSSLCCQVLYNAIIFKSVHERKQFLDTIGNRFPNFLKLFSTIYFHLFFVCNMLCYVVGEMMINLINLSIL